MDQPALRDVEPSLFASLTFGAGLGVGPSYRVDAGPLVSIDLSAVANLSVLFANDTAHSPLVCAGGELGATVSFGKDGLVPYLRFTGGFTHQTIVQNVVVPGAFLAVGFTWMRT